MKKYFAIAASLLALAACSKKEANVQVVPAPEAEIDAPVPVLFGNSGVEAEVKGLGSIDAFDGAQKLVVFGHDVAQDLTQGYLIDGVEAASPVDPTTDSHIVVKNAAGEYFYYEGSKVYEFFAYHIDDAENPVVNKTADAVSVNFTLDGSQDILYANADTTLDVAGKTYTPSGTTTAVPIPASRAYSAWSARRGVTPNLPFKHAGSLFEFAIEDMRGTGADAMYIDSLAIKSYADAVLTFKAAKDTLVAASAAQLVPLTMHIDDLKEEVATVADYEAVEVEDIDSFGPGLIVVPGAASYTGSIKLTQLVESAEGVSPKSVVNDFTLDFANRVPAYAQAGYKYKVTIRVYALEKIEITVSLEAWEEGDEFTIDEDE